jgi:hypothetical protein
VNSSAFSVVEEKTALEEITVTLIPLDMRPLINSVVKRTFVSHDLGFFWHFSYPLIPTKITACVKLSSKLYFCHFSSLKNFLFFRYL